MDAAADHKDALYERYLAVPQHNRAEIINGVLYVMSRPAPPHANASSTLGAELNGPFQRGRGGPGGWWILDQPELQLSEKSPMCPDLAGWHVERLPELPKLAYFTLPPDWICEILSPSTAAIDRGEKLPLYASYGIPHVWVIDPIGKTLEVHSDPIGTKFTMVHLHQAGARVRVPPFEAIELEVDVMWSAPVVNR